ncbi:uracil-DNA glycosylase [Acidihalobacter prosperus]
MTKCFDPACQCCPRLSGFLKEVKKKHPSYHCAPVPSFGALSPRLLIIGLAPGKHGANATGRPFTGDYAGILLYRTLHRYGFSNLGQVSDSNDGLILQNCRITNAVKCLPPDNKPTNEEIINCNQFLSGELQAMPSKSIMLALGVVAHKATLRCLGLKQVDYPFAHAAEYNLPDGRHLLSSYHCSRYNTQTGRLTEAMFDSVIRRARDYLDG